MRKTFVLDTNVLLHSAESIESFEDNIVAIPMEVIEELDKFKTRNDELGRNARRVIRRLDELREVGPLRQGVELNNGGLLKILMPEDSTNVGLDQRVMDNKILMAAYTLRKVGDQVIFVSKDISARLKADALDLETADFKREKVNFDELYTGYREIMVPAELVDKFYETNVLELEESDLLPNEFLLMRDEIKPKHTALCKAINPSEVTHLCSRFERAYGIKPRSKEQRMALELLMDPDVYLVTLIGAAGTGKTLLALAAALECVEREQRYDKVLVGRPIVPFGNDIGYLPGDKNEKLEHWMQPIFDNLAYLMMYKHKGKSKGEYVDYTTERGIKKEVESLLENTVDIEALTYIRGRSIPKQYVIIDEAQNLTPHEVKTIISRAGEGTKIILTGDPYQIDNPYLDASSNGLIYAAERMKTDPLHGHIMLRRSERSPLAGSAAKLL